jgi:hypothetical protein
MRPQNTDAIPTANAESTPIAQKIIALLCVAISQSRAMGEFLENSLADEPRAIAVKAGPLQWAGFRGQAR